MTAAAAGPAAWNGQGRLQAALNEFSPCGRPSDWLAGLVRRGLDRIPLPGAGATLARWQALAAVAHHDLALAKLYEGHTDALAILQELRDPAAPGPDADGMSWGMWAAEAPQGRVTFTPGPNGDVLLDGIKCWCSGAEHVSHGLLTAWHADGSGPQLVRVAMHQPSVVVDDEAWNAVGMSRSESVDVVFRKARAVLVGQPGDYLSRPGFWHGGAGVAACWYGGALTLAASLGASVQERSSASAAADSFRPAALGKVDMALQGTAALLREAAQWIDTHPGRDARAVALRVRLAAEDCARRVLDETGRALGATPFCRDNRFARAAADLPVFVRQSHAERDFSALGQCVAALEESPWKL